MFSFIPIHAAGMYGSTATECCSDYVVSSYIPTIASLVNAQEKQGRLALANVKVLPVAEPLAPGYPPLPQTVTEVCTVARLALAAGLTPFENADDSPDSGVTVEAVKKKLPRANVLHLACHGVQESRSPLESGFCLRDGRLTIGDIMTFDLRNAAFAFCSACETAKGDEAQPDQIVHLAAALLFAGFKSVIGTMWCVCRLPITTLELA
jgi:CHAT domain-containing protein